jgi:hypothetical protein
MNDTPKIPLDLKSNDNTPSISDLMKMIIEQNKTIMELKDMVIQTKGSTMTNAPIHSIEPTMKGSELHSDQLVLTKQTANFNVYNGPTLKSVYIPKSLQLKDIIQITIYTGNNQETINDMEAEQGAIRMESVGKSKYTNDKFFIYLPKQWGIKDTCKTILVGYENM